MNATAMNVALVYAREIFKIVKEARRLHAEGHGWDDCDAIMGLDIGTCYLMQRDFRRMFEAETA